jgi:TonB family protein
MMIGTPAYMSPEQAKGMRGEQLDGRSDIYSLGVVMYQMLAGELPLKADSTLEQLMAHLNTPPRPIREVRPDLPTEVASVVMRCLEKNRELRPANGQDLVDQLQAAMNPPAASSVISSVISSPVVTQRERQRERDVVTVPEPARAASLSPDKTASIPVEVPSISSEGGRTVPTRAWLWAAILVFVVAAGGGIAYFLRQQPAAENRPESSAKVTSPAVPPHSTDRASKTPPPPVAPDVSTDGNPMQPDDAPVRAAVEMPHARKGAPETKPSSSPPQTPAKPLSTPPPAVNSVNTSKPSTAVAQPAAPQSPTSSPDRGIQPVPGVSTAGATPPGTHPASATSAATGAAPAGIQNPSSEPVVYHVGAGVSAPSILSAPQPDYTDDASRARKQGNCVLSLIVDATGRARNIRVVTPLGFGLDEKAIEAVQRWRFQPGSKDGKPVNVQINVEVEFRQY